MRERKLQSRDFNVPLQCQERNEILRYVSRNKSFDDDIDDPTSANTRTDRPRSEPPAKFSFLSGIHPDLDDALCEIQSRPNSRSRRSDVRRRINDAVPSSSSSSSSSGKTNLAFSEEWKSSRKRENYIERNHNHNKSKENFLLEEELGVNEFRTCTKQDVSMSAAASSTCSYLGSRIIEEKGDSVVDSESSKPKEITCAKGMNDSIDSLPFSVDGMERAKRRIKSQAAKIRDLEAKLEKAAIAQGIKKKLDEEEEEEEKRAAVKKIMSPEERLEAHIERKRLENKYKEKSGKWDDPPPVKHENMTSKVKRKDKLVDRLVADPKHRRKQDEESKRLRHSLQKLDRATSDDEQFNEMNGDRASARRSSTGKTNRTKLNRNNSKAGGTMPKSLMKRLNMSVKERRKMKKGDDQVPDDLRRTLRGHRIQKKSWRMSQEFDMENSRTSSSEEGDFNYVRDESLEECIQCETCMSSVGCEEDIDNPGIYYCRKCWEEYECNQEEQTNSFLNEESINHNEKSSSYHDKEYSPRQEIIQQKTKMFDEALWIIHDNPKLGGRLTWSGSKKMNCLVETKDPTKKNCVRILHGQIDYCGTVSASGTGNQVVKETDRGAECIRIGNIKGFTIDHDKVETRLAKNKSIYEFRLNPKDSIQLTGRDSQMQLQDFLHKCGGAVDVILAPQCSPGGWYPQREASSNYRKIAPQFRSNGFGYIRLGDDMGNNGLAFLSSDSCQSFFSTPETVSQPEYNEKFLRSTSSFTSNRKTKSNISNKIQSSTKKKSNILKCSTKSQHNHAGVNDGNSCDFSFSSVSSCDEDDQDSICADILLKELQNFEVTKDVKWKEKAELLLRLGKAVEKPQGRGACSNVLSYIQDIISAKNVNINVLRNALLVVESVGEAMKEELVYHISWKTIFIEILNLLKNKRVGNGAKEILRNLHGKCFTLSNSMVAVSHVLGMGKTSTNHRKSISSIKQVSSSKSNQLMQKSNNVEIIEWLAETTETERMMEEVDPLIDEGGLSQLAMFFFSHESHRDANCRKNALDGMLHTVLYGIERLKMDKSEALKLCLEVKTMNPRSWTRLTKSVNQALKDYRNNKR